ncbi:MAG: NADH-quinone oxidoreductase subunit K [Silvanigrellales bacterium]|jgi:multicomponent Na+:H+ antiporter subunit C|nr:NADH-quinone oxidoreductase subunit K [Silvanigrellales bacterium]
MQVDLAFLIGFLFTVGVFLVLEKHLLSVFFGLALLSNAANVFLLVMSGPPNGLRSPIVSKLLEDAAPEGALRSVDPLPQALILTAIVIGSGILMYAVFLVYRLAMESGTTDLDAIHDNTAQSSALGSALRSGSEKSHPP